MPSSRRHRRLRRHRSGRRRRRNSANQRLVHLGEYAPGEIVTRNVDFTLTCAGIAHADEGNVITIQPSSYNVPVTGTASATYSRRSVRCPPSWTHDDEGCPSPAPTLPANGPASLPFACRRPPALATSSRSMYARVGGNGMTGTTAVSFEVDVVVPNTPPVLSLPGPITAEAASSGRARPSVHRQRD